MKFFLNQRGRSTFTFTSENEDIFTDEFDSKETGLNNLVSQIFNQDYEDVYAEDCLNLLNTLHGIRSIPNLMENHLKPIDGIDEERKYLDMFEEYYKLYQGHVSLHKNGNKPIFIEDTKRKRVDLFFILETKFNTRLRKVDASSRFKFKSQIYTWLESAQAKKYLDIATRDRLRKEIRQFSLAPFETPKSVHESLN